MDVVTLGQAKAQGDKRYTAFSQRRRDLSFTRGLVPVTNGLMASQSPTTSASSSLSDGTTTSKFQRRKVTVTTQTTDLRLVFENFNYGTAGPNAFTVTAAIETASPSASYPVTFNGAKSVSVDPDAVVTSDPVPIIVTAGDTLYIRTYVSVATSGQKWPCSAYYYQSGEAVTNDADLTASTGTTGVTNPNLSAGYVLAFAPAIVLGTPTAATPPDVFAAFGDSITVGINDVIQRSSHGWVERALDTYGGISRVNLSRHTELVQQMLNVQFTPVAYRQKMRLLNGCTKVISSYGVNDMGSGASTVQTSLLAHWTELKLRGVRKIWQYTFPPRTSSTDGWLSTTNQGAQSSEGARTATNDWIRAGAPISAGAPVAVGTTGATLAGQSGHPLDGYIETADTVETARNSGLWKVGRIVTDAAMTAGQGVLTSATANFTAADVGKVVGVAGAGSAGGMYINDITVVNSATSVNVRFSASTTVTNARAAIPVYTQDGIHPSGDGYDAMASALVSRLGALVSA
jgi:hypothetical protein